MKKHYIFLLLLCLVSSFVRAQNQIPQICIHHWCTGEGIEGTALSLESNTTPGIPPISLFQSVNGNGCSLISNAIPFASGIKVTPTNSADTYTGTLADLQANIARIQRHIDGIEPFTDMWQWIAADMNSDSTISSEDVLTLQAWGSGNYVNYPLLYGKWRFIPKSYIFPNPATPLIPDPPRFLYAAINGNNDFWGIELGNLVNNTACAFSSSHTPPAFSASAAAPNPSSDGFSVQLNLLEASELHTEIFDLTGKCISTTSAQSYASGISTVAFASVAIPGIYIWKITGTDGQYVAGKIVQQ